MGGPYPFLGFVRGARVSSISTVRDVRSKWIDNGPSRVLARLHALDADLPSPLTCARLFIGTSLCHRRYWSAGCSDAARPDCCCLDRIRCNMR